MDTRPHALMTFDEYLAWLDEYWELVGPPTSPNLPYVEDVALL